MARRLDLCHRWWAPFGSVWTHAPSHRYWMRGNLSASAFVPIVSQYLRFLPHEQKILSLFIGKRIQRTVVMGSLNEYSGAYCDRATKCVPSVTSDVGHRHTRDHYLQLFDECQRCVPTAVLLVLLTSTRATGKSVHTQPPQQACTWLWVDFLGQFRMFCNA